MSKENKTEIKSLHEIRLPVEEALWNKVLADDVATKLLSENPQIVLLGTDPFLILAKKIISDYRDVKVTIIEREPYVVESASQIISPGEKIFPICNDALKITPEEFGDNQLIIAQHLIHFSNAFDLLTNIRKLFPSEGLFFASTPIIADVKTRLELAINKNKLHALGITFTHESLEGESVEQSGRIFRFSFQEQE